MIYREIYIVYDVNIIVVQQDTRFIFVLLVAQHFFCLKNLANSRLILRVFTWRFCSKLADSAMNGNLVGIAWLSYAISGAPGPWASSLLPRPRRGCEVLFFTRSVCLSVSLCVCVSGQYFGILFLSY